MFCENCGEEIKDDAVICPYCGASVQKPVPRKGSNTIATVGFVFAFFIPLVGLICSIIGLNNAKRYNVSGKSLAIAGIIISIVVWILSTIVSAVNIVNIMNNMAV